MPFKAKLNESTRGCPTDLLRFDTNNPRLEDGGVGKQPKDENAMIKSLRDVAALGELVQSICANDYKDIEPLIVKGPENGPYTVLEGNRRLASIRLIQNRKLADDLGIALPAKIPKKVLDSIKAVSVYRVASPDVARAYIGFKHINGPHRWESFAKARFVTEWYKTESVHGLTVDAIAEQLGDDNKTIRNMVAGMFVLEQASRDGFSIANRYNKGRFAFSHLYTALTRTEFVDFLGLKKGWSEKPRENPVAADKKPALRELMTWLYGAKDRDLPALILSQNPDLAILGQVIRHPIAMRVIRAGRSLEEAKKEMRPVQSVLSDVLVEVNHKLREAVSLASRAEQVDDSIRDIAKQINKQAVALTVLLEHVDDNATTTGQLQGVEVVPTTKPRTKPKLAKKATPKKKGR